MTTNEEVTDWSVVHHSSRSGQSTCDLELRVGLDRPLDEADKAVVRDAMSGLEKRLLARSALLHPDNVEWKRSWLASARGAFEDAGLAPIHVKEIDNEYCGALCCPHRVWLRVTTRVGPITVGWRKHVIVVDWTRSDIEATANDLFRFEETTKGYKDVHAHGYEKMAEYLTRIAGEWPNYAVGRTSDVSRDAQSSATVEATRAASDALKLAPDERDRTQEALRALFEWSRRQDDLLGDELSAQVRAALGLEG